MNTPSKSQRLDELKDEVWRRLFRALPMIVTVAVLLALATLTALSLQQSSTGETDLVVAGQLDDKVESEPDGSDGATGQESEGSSGSEPRVRETLGSSSPAGPDATEEKADERATDDGAVSDGDRDAAADGAGTSGVASGDHVGAGGPEPGASQSGTGPDDTTDPISNGSDGSGVDGTPPPTSEQGGGNEDPDPPPSTDPPPELIPPACLPDEVCGEPCDGPECAGIGVGGTEPPVEPEPCPMGHCACDPETDPDCDPVDDDTPTCLPGELPPCDDPDPDPDCLPGQLPPCDDDDGPTCLPGELPPCDDSGPDPDCLPGQLPPCDDTGPGPGCLPGQAPPCGEIVPVCVPPFCDTPIDPYPLPSPGFPITPIEPVEPIVPIIPIIPIDPGSGVVPGLPPGQG